MMVNGRLNIFDLKEIYIPEGTKFYFDKKSEFIKWAGKKTYIYRIKSKDKYSFYAFDIIDNVAIFDQEEKDL